MEEITILGVPIEIWAIVGPFAGGLIGVGLSGLISWITSSNRIKADLKASTRLEWIKEVRTLTANIINSYFLVKRYYLDAVRRMPPSKCTNYSTSREYKKLSKELITLSNDITLFKLYFATIKENEAKVEQPNKKNIFIRKAVDKVKQEATEYKMALDKPHPFKLQVEDDVIDEFQRASSNYLKREWNRAKKNQ